MMHHPSQAKEWYFLSPTSKKYIEGGQCNSLNNDGYWEPCGTDSLIHKDGKLIGYRKTLNYIEGKHEKDRKRTEWLMHEYRLDRSRDVRTGTTSDDMQWVFCKLFKSSDKFLAAADKVATKFAGPNDGGSSTDHIIQGRENENDLTDDKGPNNDRCCDLHPLPETNQGTMTPYSSKLLDQASKISSFDKLVTYSLPQHDQGTIVPTAKPQYVQRTTVTPPPPACDQGFMMPHLPNAKSQPTRDQGTTPTSTRPHKAKDGVVTDKGPSNSLNCDLHSLAASSQGLVIPRCSEKILGEPTGICSFDAQLPKPPLVEGLPRGSHENEAAVAQRYDGLPLYTAQRLPPLDGPFEFLTEQELDFFAKPDPEYPQAYEKKKEAKK